MSLREMLSDYWYAFQQELFPRLEGELGPMGERYELFVAVLELVRVEALLPYFRGQVGRPEEDRAALARAFIAKAVFDVPTTRGLIERLEVDGRLCRLCGWSGAGRLPSEATFSRAFSEFAESGLASRLHETLIARTMDGHLVEHISRDATAIEVREKPAPKAAKPKRRRKRGRPRKGEEQAKEPSRLERQLTMSLPQMLADLPRACDVGAKRNATARAPMRASAGLPCAPAPILARRSSTRPSPTCSRRRRAPPSMRSPTTSACAASVPIATPTGCSPRAASLWWSRPA